eukprot:154304-Chlamydomonas_euryale.AAC.3
MVAASVPTFLAAANPQLPPASRSCLGLTSHAPAAWPPAASNSVLPIPRLFHPSPTLSAALRRASQRRSTHLEQHRCLRRDGPAEALQHAGRVRHKALKIARVGRPASCHRSQRRVMLIGGAAGAAARCAGSAEQRLQRHGAWGGCSRRGGLRVSADSWGLLVRARRRRWGLRAAERAARVGAARHAASAAEG